MIQKGSIVGNGKKLRSLARRVAEVGPSGLARLGEAFFWMLAAKAALAWVPVARVIGWKKRRLEVERVADGSTLQHVRHAVLVAARYSPVSLVCFPQCLAASEMLRHRGIASRLHYGVARDGDKLVTHTWLEAGGEIVIGGEVAAEYSTLAVY